MPIYDVQKKANACMKIAITGAHRVGKTTLAKKLHESFPGCDCYTEPYFELEDGYAPHNHDIPFFLGIAPLNVKEDSECTPFHLFCSCN